MCVTFQPSDYAIVNESITIKYLHEYRLYADPGARGRGSGPPWKIKKAIGFLSSTGLDALENHKATKPTFTVVGSSK